MGGRKQTSDGDGTGGSRAHEEEGDGESSEDEDEGAGPAGRPIPATTIGARCGRTIKRLFGRVKNIVSTYGKAEFKEDIRARAAAKAAGQPVEKDQDEEPPKGVEDAATGEAQPQVPHRAGQPGPRKQGSSLNEFVAVVIMGQPNGRLKTIMTDDMAADPVCLRQVEMLEAAMQCRMLQYRITDSNHARAAARLEQRGVSGAACETVGIAPSKVALQDSRAAFTKQIRPMFGHLNLKFCSDLPDKQWQSFVMETGADACAAVGLCKHAREVLDWPEDLQCVDPNRVGPGMPWSRRFFQWLIEMGKVEGMPASLRGKQRCVRASTVLRVQHCCTL